MTKPIDSSTVICSQQIGFAGEREPPRCYYSRRDCTVSAVDIHMKVDDMAYLGTAGVWKGFATRVYRSQLSLGYSHKPCLTSECRLPLRREGETDRGAAQGFRDANCCTPSTPHLAVTDPRRVAAVAVAVVAAG